MIVIESINYVSLTVSNLDEGVKFYKEMFDFEVIEKISNSGQAFLRMGEIIICLAEQSGYKADESKNRIAFYMDEEDFDDAVDEIEESGLKVVYGPENIRGGKTMVFLDPDGNQIELSYPRID